MYKNILITLALSVFLSSTATAKQMTKSGGYTLCKNHLKAAHPGRSIDTKIVRIKYWSHKKSTAGMTHKITIRVAGIKDSAYKANCVVTHNHDNYVAVINDIGQQVKNQHDNHALKHSDNIASSE